LYISLVNYRLACTRISTRLLRLDFAPETTQISLLAPTDLGHLTFDLFVHVAARVDLRLGRPSAAMLTAFTARPIIELKPRDKSKIETILAHGV